MKFKVTATIPVELEIDCQSKEEALDTATTILQEQRDDGDYASIVADCIESALVSGSITMTAVDNHEALVNELRTKRKISIHDMDAFLGYEIDIFVIYAETYGDDFDMELEMNDAEYATVLADFKKKFKDTFGKSLEDIWNEESEEE